MNRDPYFSKFPRVRILGIFAGFSRLIFALLRHLAGAREPKAKVLVTVFTMHTLLERNMTHTVTMYRVAQKDLLVQ